MADLKFYPEPNRHKQQQDENQFFFYFLLSLVFTAVFAGFLIYMGCRGMAVADQQKQAAETSAIVK